MVKKSKLKKIIKEPAKTAEPQLPKKDLKQLAWDICAGLVFTDREINPPSLMTHVFMPLLFLTEEQRLDLVKNAVLIYEYISKAGPRMINGYPMFMSFFYLNAQELNEVIEHQKTIIAFKKNFDAGKLATSP